MTLPLPETLTPSKVSAFMSCPLAFRYTYIDKLPSPSTTYQVKGTLVHRALQLLFSNHLGEQRTFAKGEAALEEAWDEMRTSADVVSFGFDGPAEAAFLTESRSLLTHYFNLEDPAPVCDEGVELDLRARLGDIELRGIIDRLDRLESGEYAVTDYKTGRSPRPEHARSAMLGVQFYAYLCEAALGRRPVEVRLMYLRDQVVIVDSPSDQMMRGLRQRALAVWAAIERGCASEDFRPNPSALCKSCAFQELCPAMAERRVALAS